MYAGDLNAIQDAAAALSDYAQTIGAGTYRIGESGLYLNKYATGIAQLVGELFITSGLGLANLTTTQRNAIAAGGAPKGTIIFNTTTGTLQINIGTDGARAWKSYGGLQSRQVITNGTTSYTLPSSVSTINIREVGGGGGGHATSGAGGGAGGYVEKLITAPSASYVVAVGAGGAAGSAGGNTTMASTTAGGGGAGLNTNPQGGVGGTATGGDVNVPGEPGDGNAGGRGGSGPWGGAGKGGTGSGNAGTAAAANSGAGGGGGATGGGAGAAGGSGVIIVDES